MSTKRSSYLVGIVFLTGAVLFVTFSYLGVKTKPVENFLSNTVMGKVPVHSSVVIVDTTSPDADRTVPTFPCVPITFNKMRIPTCTYLPQDNDWASNMALKGQLFESKSILDVMKVLDKDSSFQFVDIGANLGVYTLPIAHSKRDVLAVEATLETVKKIRKSIYLGDVSEHVTLLHNAMLDGHRTLALSGHYTNRMDTRLVDSANCTQPDGVYRCLSTTVKTITMDDLIPLMKSDKVIMKVDIQGAEIKTFISSAASKFFKAIEVPFIFMEWHMYKESYGNVAKRKEIDEWLKFFYQLNYTVHDENTEAVLGKNWESWTYNVVFKKPYKQLGLLSYLK